MATVAQPHRDLSLIVRDHPRTSPRPSTPVTLVPPGGVPPIILSPPLDEDLRRRLEERDVEIEFQDQRIQGLEEEVVTLQRHLEALREENRRLRNVNCCALL